MNSFRDYVLRFNSLLTAARRIQPGRAVPKARPPLPQNAPCAMIFAPHPDDEAIIGALPLRLRKEAGYRIINVAVTLGSIPSRRSERKREARKACRYLDFDLLTPSGSGFENINMAARKNHSRGWKRAVREIAAVLDKFKPRAVFFPHARDGHATHVGTHYLVADALDESALRDVFLVETEFWHPMTSPNIMVASSREDVAELVAALSFHVGEIERNPYHLALPAWLYDNVRRGSERLFGQGGRAPVCHFATLYRLKRRSSGRYVTIRPAQPFVGVGDHVSRLFEAR